MLVFAAGFLTCLVCTVALSFSLQHRVVQRPSDGPNEHLPALLPPMLPFSQPAAFDFRVSGKDGRLLDLQKYRGKVIVLNHWATDCGPCMAELPSFGVLSAHYARDKDVAVVCVSDELADVVFNNARALASGAPIYSINGTRLPDTYTMDKGVPLTFIPVTFIIDPQGTIAFRSIGSANWADPTVIRFIDSLKARQTPDASHRG